MPSNPAFFQHLLGSELPFVSPFVSDSLTATSPPYNLQSLIVLFSCSQLSSYRPPCSIVFWCICKTHVHVNTHTVFWRLNIYQQTNECVSCNCVWSQGRDWVFSLFSAITAVVVSLWIAGCWGKILLTCPWAWKPQSLCVFHVGLEIKCQRRKKRI